MTDQKENSPLQLANYQNPTVSYQKSRTYGVIEVDLNAPTTAEGNPSNIPRSRRLPLTRTSLLVIGVIAVVVAVVLVVTLTSLKQPTSGPGPDTDSPVGGTQNSRSLLKAEESPSSAGGIDIQIPLGKVRGYPRKSRKGREFHAFYKIPYAKPPLGELRFKDPEPVEPWNDSIRGEKEVAPQCIQKSKYSKIVETAGEEDCLYGNVYTPQLPGNGDQVKFPTMVYVHGGGFTDGNGSRYGAEYFMDEDVVLVNFQYRLGPLGFLNTGDFESKGNMAFKDQVMMLRWVQDNVASFGGDPGQVTIFGNSAGGVSVSFLMVSPMSKGLFHRAITQSGPSICAALGIILDLHPEKTVEQLSKTLDCPSEDTAEFISCLRTKPASDVALVRTPDTIYGLTVETREGDSDNNFMPDQPYNIIKSGEASNVPYIIGINSAEWVGQALGILMDPEKTSQLNSNFTQVANEELSLNLNEEELTSIKKFYFGEREIGNETIVNVTNMVSDRTLGHCSYTAARMHADFGNTYLYYLSKPPALSYADKRLPGFPAKDYGFVSHADELQFLFPYYGYPEIPVGDPEYFSFSQYFVKLWANFAKTGNPEMNEKEWGLVNGISDGEETRNSFWFELNDTPRETRVLNGRMQFWDQFTHEQLRYKYDNEIFSN